MLCRILLGLAVICAGVPAEAETCPRAIDDALRLLLVTSPTMNGHAASLQSYERASPKDTWRRIGEPQPVVVGNAGLAWGRGFTRYAEKGQPTKIEGDRRTPAGVFALGATFGFSAAPFSGHIVLSDDTVCVDDPNSPHYNRIMKKQDAGKVASVENMRRIPLYRKGIVVDYASDGATKAGSCIFLHAWRSAQEGTSGCVAMPEAAVERLQAFTRERAALVVLPRSAVKRLSACLPVVEVDSKAH